MAWEVPAESNRDKLPRLQRQDALGLFAPISSTSLEGTRRPWLPRDGAQAVAFGYQHGLVSGAGRGVISPVLTDCGSGRDADQPSSRRTTAST
jgi:hypothetical protein